MGNIEYLSEKEHIIEVSTYLHEIGLMARTWGNVSCRVDEDHFLITPTGIRYENLTPDMIDLVNIHDLSYVGEYEPSSEMRVHAAVYSARKKAGFIIHTHQVFASCAGVLGQKKIYTYFDDEDLTIPVVAYAKPGSKKLSENVIHTLKKFKQSNGIILSNHGAICIGVFKMETFGLRIIKLHCSKLPLPTYGIDSHKIHFPTDTVGCDKDKKPGMDSAEVSSHIVARLAARLPSVCVVVDLAVFSGS